MGRRRWGVLELAERADITPNSASRIEKGGDALASTLDRIQAALEDAGVVFIDEDEEGPGVRLRKSRND